MKLGDSLGRNRKRRKRRPVEASDQGGTSGTTSDAGAGESSTAGGDTGGGRGSWLSGRTLLTGLAVVVIVGWFAGYSLATQVFFPAPAPPGDLYDVPDVRGLGLASAGERLAGAGLEIGLTDSITHPSVAAGLVLGQSPLPGQVSRPESPVRVTVSVGPQMRSVPDVLRLDEARARVVLETSGFIVNVDEVEAEEPRGQVVDVSPPPDSVVALPAQVTLLVSTGPPVVRMPLVLGLQQLEAEQLLDSLGLDVMDVEEVFRFGRDQG
ncbi:MAG: PASTA domain-containing protein, partial [Longimicrobiales bacterium]|nr:PASTA domain-containing protein [Longimicrobiales bacterium]